MQVGSGSGLQRGSGLSPSSGLWIPPWGSGTMARQGCGALETGPIFVLLGRGWWLGGAGMGPWNQNRVGGTPGNAGQGCWCPDTVPPWWSRDCKRLSKLLVQQLSRSRQQGALLAKLHADVRLQSLVEREADFTYNKTLLPLALFIDTGCSHQV